MSKSDVATKNISEKKLKTAKIMVRLILRHYLGADDKPLRIVQLGGGLTNLVFSANTASGDFVVRLGDDASKIGDFMKEQWAIAKAREKGVPAPEVLQVGNNAVPVAYMISRQSGGTEATFHPARMKIIREMGRFAATIHSIPTTGFGATFEWTLNQLSHNASWAEFVDNELKIEERIETFESCGILNRIRANRLRTTLEKAAAKDRAPALNHGDLRLKNVLVDEEGAILCILDWEHCSSNLAPEWDLALALHDLGIDERHEFLEGYGISADQVSEISPVLKALTLINYAPAVQKAAKSRDDVKLERYRLRLSGKLDLYSL